MVVWFKFSYAYFSNIRILWICPRTSYITINQYCIGPRHNGFSMLISIYSVLPTMTMTQVLVVLGFPTAWVKDLNYKMPIQIFINSSASCSWHFNQRIFCSTCLYVSWSNAIKYLLQHAYSCLRCAYNKFS